MERYWLNLSIGSAVVLSLFCVTLQADAYGDVDFYFSETIPADDSYEDIGIYDTPPSTTTIEFYGSAESFQTHDESVLNIYDGGTFWYYDGDLLYKENLLYDQSTVNVYTGSTIGYCSYSFLSLYNESTLNIRGGEITSLTFGYDESEINLYSGDLHFGFFLHGASVLNVYSGSIGCFIGNNTIESSSTLNIYGYGFEYTLQGRWIDEFEIWESKLTGYDLDDNPVTYWGIPDPATHPNIHFIPEPTLCILFGMGGLLLRCRRR